MYRMRKVIKGSTIVDHLVENAIEGYEPLDFDFPDKDILLTGEEEKKIDWWTMYFDGAVNVYQKRVDTIIISPNK